VQARWATRDSPPTLGHMVGRPRVSERPDFAQHFEYVSARLALGLLSRRQAAKELSIGYATLTRLLGAQVQTVAADTGSHCNAAAEVLD
jgi:hypothetical protein